MFAVNKELLPVKLFYLFIGSVNGIFFFNSSLARQKGIPPDLVGVMWSLFPIFTVIFLMFVTNLADRFNIHRATFLTVLIICVAAEAAVCFGPDIVEKEDMLSKHVNISCQNGNIISMSNDTSHDWLHCGSDSNTSHRNGSSIKCSVDQKVNTELNTQILTNIESAFYTVFSDNTNSDGVIEGIHLLNQSESILCPENYTLTCVNKCSSFKNETELKNSLTYEILQYPSFWLFVVSVFIFDCTSYITASFSITATLQLLGEDSDKFGFQRVWATIGLGSMALVYGAAIDYFSEGGGMRYYPAGYIISMFFWIAAFIAAIYIKFSNEEKKEKEDGSILNALKSFKVLIFMVVVLAMGMSLGCASTFLFLLIDDVANTWEPGFENLNLLQGLSQAIGCFVGEVPIMFFSEPIIKYLGDIHVFTLVLALTSARFIINAFIKNPWLFIPVEVLQGISYGMFFPNMSAYADKVAPPGRNATMQGFVNSTFIAGTSLGALIGGAGFKLVGGSQMFLYIGLADLFFMVIYVIGHRLIDREVSDSEVNLKEKEENVQVKMDQDCQTKL